MGHPWKARLVVGIIMLLLAFVGLIITDVAKSAAWTYLWIISIVFAVLCLGLSWYLRHHDQKLGWSTIWHELFHWFGMIVAIFLVSRFVSIGIVGRFEAALMVMTLLSLTTFLAGVYVDLTFVLVGVVMGLFTFSSAYLAEYLYTIMLPVAVVAVLVLFFILRYHRKQHSSKE
ncbi:MAG: hypothetical protein SP1CHLAM54_17080 [Chlamydiia bacterium]|nr:hypothetical protein [Chlamydiia bacterium]MCH9616596.1 hypothetical protein [Chlamydiia bacterium]MCH9629326.1 hypothetical protein [Chlamydiia bacterium]